LTHHQAGRLPEAEALYRQILQGQPNHPDALHLLGVMAHQAGKHEMAVEYIVRAIALQPTAAAYHSNLGEVYRALTRLDKAAASLQQALVLQPASAEARNNLGAVLQAQGKLDEAIAQYRQALALKPAYPEAHNNLGNVLKKQGKQVAAAAQYRQAILHKPDYAEAYNNLGEVLAEEDKWEEAVAQYRRAVALKPVYAEAYYNLGNALKAQGKLEEAIECYCKALSVNPDLAEAHWNKALTLLRTGNFMEGWREYEWRWQCAQSKASQRDFSQRLWDGQDLAGQTILLHAEQGFGDTVQCIRYVPLVAKRGGQVIVECQPELKSLFESGVQGMTGIVARGGRLPDFDVQAPFLSLPLIFETTIDSIPAKVPYIVPSPKRVTVWHVKRELQGDTFKIGLAWAGLSSHQNDRSRSCPLKMLAPLATVRGVTWYSLQKGEGASQAADPPEGVTLIDMTAELTDFTETAALMSHLDLVISVDTAVAHLAGAMGKPVWTLLPFVSDWRWLLNRDDSPWYPTMRLFRQKSPGDWHGTVACVVEALQNMVRRRNAYGHAGAL